MLPLSTGNTNGCNPISSNCIIWQGPDLNCINVCNGDTISIVIAKIAEYLCAIADVTADIDITQWTQGCVGEPNTATNFTELIQYMINYICNMSSDIYNENGIVYNLEQLIQNYEDLQLIINEGGQNGQDGVDGVDGIGIESIETIYDESGVPTGEWLITYTDGGEWISDDLTGPPGEDGQDGLDGEPGEGFEMAKIDLTCFGNDDISGGLYINSTPEADTASWVQIGPGEEISNMLFISPDPELYREQLSDGTYLYYNGWAHYVQQKMCCLLRFNSECGPSQSGGEADPEGQPDMTAFNSLKNRIIKLEKKGGTSYVPPKILSRCVGDVGKRMEIHRLLDALQIDYCKLRSAIGGSAEVLKASRSQCINLASEKRLSGEGVMSTMPGWYNAPSNLSQSFSNAWNTICDIRTAVSNLQNQVTPSGCAGFTYKPKLNLTKNGAGAVNGINILFSDCIVPQGFYDCDKGRGTRITVEDSSLNSHTHYANVTALTSSTTGTSINNLASYGLDTGSNFKIKIYFCFTDGSNQCESIQEYTLDNTSACPTIALTNIGENSIEYSITGMNVSSKSTYEIIVSDTNGSMISKQTIKHPSVGTTTGKAAGLAAGTSYNIYAKVTPLVGSITTCDASSFTTTAPVCATVSKTSTDYKTAIADLGTTKVTVATYKSGGTTTAWIVGFNSLGSPEVYKGTDSDETGTNLEFVLNTTPISDNPTTSINCANVAYPATGMTTLMNSNENGWQYVDSLKSNGNTTYYIYALANTANKSIDQVVFCCDCKPSYVRPKYGNTATKSTSEAYSPDRHAWYVVTGKKLRIPIDIIGYSEQVNPIQWSATSTLGGTTDFVLPSNSGYDTALGGTVQLEYTPNTVRPSGGIDSIDVYAETDCTKGNAGNRTINTITIPIVDASTIQNTDTDITVFIDTNVVSTTEASVIKSEIERVKTSIQSNCSTWTGTVNYVPVAGGNSGDYIDYTKAMVDKANGGSGSITIHNGYTAVKSLPSYWSAGGAIPSSVYLICFIGKLSNYGPLSLTNGWSTQPTSKYQQNFDELLDILYVNGTAKTTWGTTNNCTFKKFDLKQVLVPVVSGSQDESAATILQTAGALTGTVLSEIGLNGFATGSVQNPINISDYIGPNSSQMVPYTGTTVGASNTIIGLSSYGFSVVPFIDKSYLETDSNKYSGGDQSNFLGNAILRVTGADSSGMGLSSDAKCPTGTDSVKLMNGTLEGTSVILYGNDSGDPTSCSKAGTAALTASGCIKLYNTTGVQFDPSVPAYLSPAGGNAGATSDQPVDEAWYAQLGAASTNAVRRIAQYDRDGATTGSYWKNEKYVADC